MRSRYSAFALGLEDYIFRTWHPRTRPDDLTSDAKWIGLEVLSATGDQVEFIASYEGGEIRERSLFEMRRGRWVYVEPLGGVLE